MNITSGTIQRAQKTLLYGVEGIGKTTFASKFPDPLFIDTEGGADYLDVKRLDKPTSWSMILQEVAWVKANPDSCATLVIDTADWAEMLCIEHICSKHDKDSLEAFGYGAGYTYLVEEFGRLLNALSDLTSVGINILITAHAQMRKFEQPDDLGSYDRWELKLSAKGTKKVAPMVKEWADAILFANYETFVVNVDGQGTAKGKNKVQGGKRVMHTDHHPCWDAKNRWGLPEKVDFDFAQIAAHVPSRITTAAPAPVSESAHSNITTSPSGVSVVDLNPQTPTEHKIADAIKNAKEVDEDHGGYPAYFTPLFDLMKADNISEDQLAAVCASRGYVTIDTALSVYPENFVAFLVSNWKDVKDMAQALPYQTDQIPF